jgi:hypothetical protein
LSIVFLQGYPFSLSPQCPLWGGIISPSGDLVGREAAGHNWPEAERYPGKMKPEQPGVNGVRYAVKTNYLYYTATAKKPFMRVAVNPHTLEAQGEPELVVAGRMGDDFCIEFQPITGAFPGSG